MLQQWGCGSQIIFIFSLFNIFNRVIPEIFRIFRFPSPKPIINCNDYTSCIITVYSDRSFTFITKTPPASVLLLKAAKIEKGSGEPNKTKVGKVTKKQVEDIAKLKMPDLNAGSLAAAMRTIEGTARSAGITVSE